MQLPSLTKDNWWRNHFQPADARQGFDYISTDGEIVVEIKQSNVALREFHAGIVQLALVLDRMPEIKWACLVFVSDKLSDSRVVEEWDKIKKLFNRAISTRLCLVAIIGPLPYVEPEDSFLLEMSSVIKRNSIAELQASSRMLSPAFGMRFAEIVKILLVRWLRQEEPISIGQLADTVGCTYPTLREAFNKFEKWGYIKRNPGRTVEFNQFPNEYWRLVLGQSSNLRQSISFMDTSGGRTDPLKLMERLKRLHPATIALGGVIAARHWDPDFDLNGTPRLDLSMHAPDGYLDLSFLRMLDPALREIHSNEVPPVLVIHPLQRAKSLFTENPNALPMADPVETALDLQEMGLTQQANALFHHLRKEVRLA